MCVVTRLIRPKNELFRIVKTNDGEILIDVNQSINGRGAYISKDKDIILKAQKRNILSKALKSNVKEEIYHQLLELL